MRWVDVAAVDPAPPGIRTLATRRAVEATPSQPSQPQHRTMEDVQPQRNCAVDVLTFALSACPTFKKILLSCDQALSGHANDINQLITFFEKCNAGRLSLHIPKLVDQEVRTLEDLHLLNDDDLIEIGLSRDDAKLLYKLLQNIGVARALVKALSASTSDDKISAAAALRHALAKRGVDAEGGSSQVRDELRTTGAELDVSEVLTELTTAIGASKTHEEAAKKLTSKGFRKPETCACGAPTDRDPVASVH